jgi:hypothetical protein
LSCTTPPPRQPPPLRESVQADWSYAAYLLYTDDPTTAQLYLERAAALGIDSLPNQAQFFRDLSEARLFAGDSAGAAAAARTSRERLAVQPRTAQFQADDRRLFERVLDALESAGSGDLEDLARLTQTGDVPPSADAWYLLGWLREQHGELAAARDAYRLYLAAAPQWSFLRAGPGMRRHAQSVLAS